jgi:hypothetical protein
MAPDEARWLALGYAWASQDSTGTPAATPAGATDGETAFAGAFAAAWADYNAQRRGMMLPVRDAYANWQDSNGRSVFKRGDLTLTDAQRAVLRRLWDEDPDPRKPRYYEMRENMQLTAWTALTPA